MKNFLLWALLALPISAWAQLRLHGTVADSAGLALPGAMVTVWQMPDSSLVAFMPANALGRFEAALPAGEYVVAVQMMGFSTYSQEIALYGEVALAIRLKDLPIALQEVAIEAKAPVAKVAEDTISYRASDFSTATDQRAVDVLKRLPGIDVQEDGRIFYKGKRIKDMLIEGESLFGKSPETLARSLPANAIDHVQVIENYQAFGQRRNQDIALNITLQKKQAVFGDASAGAGLRAFRTNAHLFSVAKRSKALLLADFNNTGQHIFDMKSLITMASESQQSAIAGMMPPVDGMQPARVQTSFGAFSAVHHLSEKLKMHTFLLASRKKTDERLHELRYYPNAEQYRQQDTATTSQAVVAWQQQLSFQPNERHAIQGNLLFTPLWLNLRNTTSAQFAGNDTRNASTQRIGQYDMKAEIAYFGQIGERCSVDAKAVAGYMPSKNRQTIMPALFGNADDFLQANRSYTWQTHFTGSQQYQLGRKLAFIHSVSADKEWERRRMQEAPSGFDQTGRLNSMTLKTGAFIDWESASMNAHAGANLAKYAWTFEGAYNQSHQKRLLIEPALSLDFALPASQKLQFGYERKHEVPVFEQLNAAYAANGAQLLTRGNGQLQLMPIHQWRAQYTWQRLFSGVMLFAMAMHERNAKSIGTSQQVGLLTTQQYQQFGQASSLYMLYASKSFAGKASVKADIQYNSLASESIVNEVLSQFSSRAWHGAISAYTHHKGAVNGEVRWKYKEASSIGDLAFSNAMHALLGKIVVQMGKKANWQLQGEQYLIENGQDFLLLGISATYQAKEHVLLSIEGANLLDQQYMQQASVAAFYASQERQALLGRYLMGSVQYRF